MTAAGGDASSGNRRRQLGLLALVSLALILLGSIGGIGSTSHVEDGLRVPQSGVLPSGAVAPPPAAAALATATDDCRRTKPGQSCHVGGSQAPTSDPAAPRTALSVLPHSLVGVNEMVVADFRTAWDENGDRGWRRLSRRAGESHATCESLTLWIDEEYALGRKRYGDFKTPPSYNMPWYYHDSPAPLCGQVLLRHYLKSTQHVFTLRLPSSAAAPAKEYIHLPTVDPADQRNGADPLIGGGIDEKTETLFARVGQPNSDLMIENCGACGRQCATAFRDVLLTARLVGFNGFIPATVVPVTGEANVAYRVHFTAQMPGQYALEVKVVHFNGSSESPAEPKSLGVIGIRANEGGRKAFKYNALCDEQRHIFGSPIKVVVLLRDGTDYGAAPNKQVTVTRQIPPFCTEANHTRGAWVRFTDSSCVGRNNPSCYGTPTWLSDAAAWNTGYLWAPDDCRYVFFNPPTGPPGSCLTIPSQPRVFLLLVGDSVTREYTKNCLTFNLAQARLQCLFANIALEGQHYSKDYASSVAKVVVENILTNNAGIFVTNLGIHHMIGPCTTAQWAEFVAYFVEWWQKLVVWHPEARNGRMLRTTEAGRAFASASPDALQFTDASQSKYPKGSAGSAVPRLERAVWLGPPTIHYARRGMGAQRAAAWDAIAWAKLEPLGFERVRAIPVTATRQEGTWDGLHYASERGKLQTKWRNRHIAPRTWNGGVANMLFTMLLNLICYGRPQ